MTDLSAAARLLLPRVPMMVKTGAFHALGLSEESPKWDLRTALIINTIRSIMAQSTSSITRQQRFSLKDPGIKGQMWVAPTTLNVDAGEDDVRQLLFKSIEEMNETGQETYDRCELKSVEAEWQAHRTGVDNKAPPPSNVSSPQMFEKLNSDLKSDGTILYFHGGAHYLMDPATHRIPVAQLCKAAGQCRALNVRYRLAPQHPFPAAILDCLVAYLSLLYPHGGSLQKEPVKPEKIIFAGDSAGGNICLSLLALLLHLQRTHKSSDSKTFKFNGHDVPLPLPLPAGIATNAAWSDFTRSSPSLVSNWHYDYLPYPSVSLTATPASAAPTSAPDSDAPANGEYTVTPGPLPKRKHQPGETLNPFPCEAWPALPPRADLYCTGESLCHPLVSPLAIPAEQWRGSCPLFFECGEEMLADEVRAVARRAASVDVPVRWWGFEAMPHCFAQMLAGTPVGKKGMDVWGEWIKPVFEGQKPATEATWVQAKTLKEESVEMEKLSGSLTDGEIFARMRFERGRKVEAYRALLEREGKGQGKEGVNGEARL